MFILLTKGQCFDCGVKMSRRKQARPIKHLEEDGATGNAKTPRTVHGKCTFVKSEDWIRL